MTEPVHHPKRIVMFVTNDLLNDPRVQREARSAARAGFRVRVVAVQSDRCRTERENIDGYEVIRVQVPRIRITYAVLTFLLSLFEFRWMAFKIGVIVKEGVNLAFGFPPGPEAPGKVTDSPSRWCRFKWSLMRGIGFLLLPLRAFRPVLGKAQLWRESPSFPARHPSASEASSRFARKWSRIASEVGFMEESFRSGLAMLWAVRSEPAAVYHGNDLPMLPIAFWAAKRSGGKALYDSHEIWVGMDPDTTRFSQAVMRWVENRYIRRMDAVVTVNDLIAEELRRQYAVRLPTVVMNCPEPASAERQARGRSLRGTLGLPPSTPIILYQGQYMPGRGLEALIESGRYLSYGVIVLRGYGANEADLRQRLTTIGVSGRVFMADPVSMADLVAAASEADVGVVPYVACSPCNYYTSPNKLFEYMLAGLALAVSNLPFMEKIVRDHDLGVVFDPTDPRHIAEQLNELVGNPARLLACRENAARAARERYNWEYEGAKLMGLYEALANGR
jgi:glycosyltransferase involved in cell wall biosynthesis